MNKLIILAVLVSSLLASCAKNKDLLTLESEDEDRRVIFRIFSTDEKPIQGAFITLIKGTDTLGGITNENGASTFLMPDGGWNAHAAHPDFLSKDTSFTVSGAPVEVSCVLEDK